MLRLLTRPNIAPSVAILGSLAYPNIDGHMCMNPPLETGGVKAPGTITPQPHMKVIEMRYIPNICRCGMDFVPLVANPPVDREFIVPSIQSGDTVIHALPGILPQVNEKDVLGIFANGSFLYRQRPTHRLPPGAVPLMPYISGCPLVPFGPINFTSNYRQYNEIAKKFTESGGECVAKSSEGRDLFKFEFGDGEKIILLTAGVHGNEYLAVMVGVHLALNPPKVPSDMKLVILPVLNPDGYHRGMNKKRDDDFLLGREVPSSGIDIAHNFPTNWCRGTVYGNSPLETKEAQFVSDFVLHNKENITLHIDIHAYMSSVIHGWGIPLLCDPESEELAENLVSHLGTAYSHVPFDSWDVTSMKSVLMNYGKIEDIGSMKGWIKKTTGARSLVIELPPPYSIKGTIENPTTGYFPDPAAIKEVGDDLKGALSLLFHDL
eukprot:NODE_112_length_1505_cov_415.375907_g110_i0.p1 GENE.NODE_112_length_1505_cov_415.375907_g110_i0~~NODE_112_length_1505_cov_415.375907_g110_i0.p1  ORF type:complete len:434 (-),score=71.41 NODE_112_length_1505_cov_415.375907_g110_i0:136-1437(-)